MAESAESLLRRGAISGKQASKYTLPILKKTKVERDNEEPFHGKQGLRDQGGRKDKGHKSFRTGHLDGDELTDIGSPERASGAPSKGGRVNAYGAPGAGEVDDKSNQKPFFPKAGGTTKASAGGRVETGGDGGSRNPMKSGTKSIDKRVKPAKAGSNKFASKKPAKQGGQYGGGGRDTQ